MEQIAGFLFDMIGWLLVGFLYCIYVYPAQTLLASMFLFLFGAIKFNSPVAQSVEHSAVNRRVVGSSPTRGATKKQDKPAKPVVESFSDEYKLPTNPFE